jgi:hypothetical protein
MRKLGVLLLALGLFIIGYTFLHDPELQKKFRLNYKAIGVEVNKHYPQGEIFFKQKEYVDIAIKILSFTLMSAPLLLLRPLKLMAFLHLLALGILITTLAINKKNDETIVYITKSVGVAGGLLYYLGC